MKKQILFKKAEAKMKTEITCQLLCGDGSGNKPKVHQPMCIYYVSSWPCEYVKVALSPESKQSEVEE